MKKYNKTCTLEILTLNKLIHHLGKMILTINCLTRRQANTTCKESVLWTDSETITKRANSIIEPIQLIKMQFQKDLSFKGREELLVGRLNNKIIILTYILFKRRKRIQLETLTSSLQSRKSRIPLKNLKRTCQWMRG